LPQAAVVTTECPIEVALFDIQIVAQDGAAVAQIGSQVKQVVIVAADQPDPEGHDLHEAPGACGRDGVFLETAFDLDQTENKLRVESGAGGFVMHGA